MFSFAGPDGYTSPVFYGIMGPRGIEVEGARLRVGGIFHMEGRLGQRPMNVYRDLFVPQGTQWRMATPSVAALNSCSQKDEQVVDVDGDGVGDVIEGEDAGAEGEGGDAADAAASDEAATDESAAADGAGA